MNISEYIEFLKFSKIVKLHNCLKRKFIYFIDRGQQVEENICALENILNVNAIYAKILTKWDHI